MIPQTMNEVQVCSLIVLKQCSSVSLTVFRKRVAHMFLVPTISACGIYENLGLVRLTLNKQPHLW